jgi:serine/threonine protein kinase
MMTTSEDMRIGAYALRERLGAGLTGETWLAQSAYDDAPVVVKLLPRVSETLADAAKPPFQNAKLDAHPNLVSTLDVLVTDDQVAVVSAHVRDALNVSEPMEYRAAVQVAIGILTGLDFLHENGISHGALKPSNVRVRNGAPLLTDYGLVERLPQAALERQPLDALAYLSPAAFDGAVSPESDLWSVGVLLYQLISGRLPYPQSDRTDLLRAVRTLLPDPLPAGPPPALHDIIYKALERSPKKSYQSASQMRAALVAFLESWQERPTLIFEAQSSPTQLYLAPQTPPETEAPETSAEPSEMRADEPPRKKVVSGRAVILVGGALCLLFVIAMFAVARRFEQKQYYKQTPPKLGSLGPLARSGAPPASSATQATLVVAPTGGDYATIAEAVAKAPAGARILVRPGVYTESLIVDKNVEIVGEGARDAIVIEARRGPCLTHRSGTASLIGLTLHGRGARSREEFFAVSAVGGDLILEDCVITSDTLACVVASGAETKVVARRCVIRDGGASGVGAWSGARVEAEACDISGHAMAGVVVSKGASVTLRRCEVKDNALFGVKSYEKGAVVVEQCRIADNAQGAFFVEPGSSLIKDGAPQ